MGHCDGALWATWGNVDVLALISLRVHLLSYVWVCPSPSSPPEGRPRADVCCRNQRAPIRRREANELRAKRMWRTDKGRTEHGRRHPVSKAVPRGDFAPGDRVAHPSYGKGAVVKVEERDDGFRARRGADHQVRRHQKLEDHLGQLRQAGERMTNGRRRRGVTAHAREGGGTSAPQGETTDRHGSLPGGTAKRRRT